jgi:hypothetical protein
MMSSREGRFKIWREINKAMGIKNRCKDWGYLLYWCKVKKVNAQFIMMCSREGKFKVGVRYIM